MRRLLGGWIVAVLAVSVLVAVVDRAAPDARAEVALRPLPPTAPVTSAPTTVPPTTEVSTTTTTAAPPVTEATTAPPPPLTAAVPSAAGRSPLPAAGTFTVAPYTGLGSWVDVYDWSETYGGGAFGVPDVDRMASLGVQTMYIQVTRWDSPTLILEPDRLASIIGRARHDGIRVVAWYLPDLEDVQLDLQRLLAAAQLPVDGLAVDVESRAVEDVNDRNQRVVSLSQALRAQLPDQVLGAIVLPPVVMEDVNPDYWPEYPWQGLAASFDVWLPMSYWTNRVGGWRDAYTYTAANIDRIRDHVGSAQAPIHTIGGIGDASTSDDIAGMLQAGVERGVIGGSLYDYRTTGDDLWSPLQGFRSG